jgi:hypothetical protein
MRKLISIIFFASITASLYSQNKLDTSKYLLRFSPLALVDPYQPNFTFGGEYRISKKCAIGLDYSHLLDVQNAQNKKVNGFIIRPTFKYFLSKNNTAFFELDFFYKRSYWNETKGVGQEYVGTLPSYYKIESFEVNKSVFEVNAKFGSRSALIENYIYLEFYCGIGLRHVGNSYINSYPNDLYISLPFFESNLGNKTQYTIPSISFALRVLCPL